MLIELRGAFLIDEAISDHGGHYRGNIDWNNAINHVMFQQMVLPSDLKGNIVR